MYRITKEISFKKTTENRDFLSNQKLVILANLHKAISILITDYLILQRVTE